MGHSRRGASGRWTTQLVSEGGFRPDGTFVPWPAHDTIALTEAFRRAVFRAFVRCGVSERENADAMLAWPHSGFHVHDAVWVPDGDTAFARRGRCRRCGRGRARERVPLRESQRRWAELLRRIYEVDPLRWPAARGRCGS